MNAHWSIRTSGKSLLFVFYCRASNSGALNGHLVYWRAGWGEPVITLSPKSTGMTLTLCETQFICDLYSRALFINKEFVCKTKNKNCDICFISWFIDFSPRKWTHKFCRFSLLQSSYTIMLYILIYYTVHYCVLVCRHVLIGAIYSSRILREQNDQWCDNHADISCWSISTSTLSSHTHTHMLYITTGQKAIMEEFGFSGLQCGVYCSFEKALVMWIIILKELSQYEINVYISDERTKG